MREQADGDTTDVSPFQYVTSQVKAAVQQAHEVEAEAEVSRADSQFGDFQTNIAMQLAKSLQKAPFDVAQPIAEVLRNVDGVSVVETAGPGFINITLTDAYWQEYLARIGDAFGWNESGGGQKVQVEFISANPTGPLTLGNARGGFIGDVLSNVLDTQGYEVTREYYFNDAGTQISKLVESVKAEAGLLEVEERQYGGAYVSKLARDFGEELVEQNDASLKKLLTQAILTDYIRPDIDKMKIEFDEWFNEMTLLEDGTFDKTIGMLQEHGLLFEREGATWVDTGKGGDPREERVFIKSNGDPAYFAPDVAYHVNIFGDRGFDMAIKELGPDHVAQFPSVKAPISLLFPDKELHLLAHQQMRLMQEGREVKMSKRLGHFVTVGELIDEVGADVARFFFLMRSADTHMDFDLDLAKEQSQKNPFWYVMYAYVRARAIQREAGDQGLAVAEAAGELNSIEREMVKQLSRLPELLEEIAGNYEVHRLTFYGYELARLFHEWYEEVRVIELPDEEAAEKLYFLQRFIRAMEAYWRVLGIEPYEQM